MISFPAGATSESIDVFLADDQGLPVTGLVAATFPDVYFSLAGATSDIAIPLVDLATITDAWQSGGLKERGTGLYRLDLPNVTLALPGHGTVRAEGINQHLIVDVLDIGPTDQSVIDAIEAAGTGVNIIAITVLDTEAVPIQSATVSLVINSTRYTATTNSAGLANLSPDEGDGTYSVRISASGYMFTPTSLAAVGDCSFSYTMVRVYDLSSQVGSNPGITRPQENPDHFGGARVKTKRRTIVVRAGSHTPARFVMETQTGQPVNLTIYGLSVGDSSESEEPAAQLLVRFAEHVGAIVAEANAAVIDVEAGLVSVIVPPSILTRSGVWLVEFIVVDEQDRHVFANQAYLYVERSTSMSECGSLPAIPEIRLYLRDFASENELLDVVDFDPSELAFAASMCVDEWNEATPMDGPRYSTQTFPWRRHWLVGISSYLFRIAAEHYTRNSLAYQSGGGSFDDKNRAQIYLQKSEMARQEWQAFVAKQKTIMSVNTYGYMEIPGYW